MSRLCWATLLTHAVRVHANTLEARAHRGRLHPQSCILPRSYTYKQKRNHVGCRGEGSDCARLTWQGKRYPN
eukprot:5067144-Pyramimonas_sp.AAC.1